jgi:hypothetical protein
MTRRCAFLACVSAAFALAAVTAMGPSASAQTNTPRTADGKLDLSGLWTGAAGGGGGRAYEVDEKGNITDTFPSRRCAPSQVKCSEYTNQSYDGEFTGRNNPNPPLYRPEHWDRVQYLDMNTNTEDPLFICQPLGLPRVGPPARIVQTANDVIFLYTIGGASSQPADYRVIPTDGRKHDPVRSQDVHFYGHSVGHWEGDTLVIESIAFNDLTWLDRGGYFHSDQMRTIERLRRDGNILTYEITVDDPEVLLEPWKVTPRQLRLNTNPNAFLPEGQPCKDYDRGQAVTQIRH